MAGGMESMTKAPYLLPGARDGYRIGDQSVVDSMMFDGLTCAFDHCAMGAGTERDAAAAGIARSAMDEVAARSHERAATAQKDGLFEAEIVAVAVPQRRGEPIVVDRDEGIRPGTTADSPGRPQGRVRRRRQRHRRQRLADLRRCVRRDRDVAGEGPGARGDAARRGARLRPDRRWRPGEAATSLLTQPARAIRKALGRVGMSVADIDLFELNEAFAAVALASTAELGVSDEIVNVNGGAIALGHPIGASGNRLALHLLIELRPAGRRRGSGGALRRRRPGRRPARPLARGCVAARRRGTRSIA